VVGETLFIVTVKNSDAILHRPLPHGKYSDTFFHSWLAVRFTLLISV